MYVPVRLLCVVALMCAAGRSEAEGTFLVFGAGNKSCSEWLESKSNEFVRYEYRQWVMGFVSGVNERTRQSQSRPMDGVAMALFVDQYCASNPLHNLTQATLVLIQETGGPRVKFSWKK